ncbi:transposase [Candidatus Pacearchaeota archaeon]|nr:transposase [Candidatus Pacearchaeota archaeon]
MYESYGSSVGNNFKHVQITTKYSYRMMQKDKVLTFCRVAIEEACKRHNIEIIILKVMSEYAHMIVNCPRTMDDAKLVQIIKGLSSYLLFRICPNLHPLRIVYLHIYSMHGMVKVHRNAAKRERESQITAKDLAIYVT